MSKTITHNYTGKSMLKLFEENKDLFYSKDPWWKNETFATEKQKKGTYEIVVSNDLANKTYNDQMKSLLKGFTVLHPAILTEAILSHYKKTGERVLENWYSRTSVHDSFGFRVDVGRFVGGGLDIGYWYDDFRDVSIGLSAGRKLASNSRKLEPVESLSLDSRLKNIEQFLQDNFNKFTI